MGLRTHTRATPSKFGRQVRAPHAFWLRSCVWAIAHLWEPGRKAGLSPPTRTWGTGTPWPRMTVPLNLSPRCQNLPITSILRTLYLFGGVLKLKATIYQQLFLVL